MRDHLADSERRLTAQHNRKPRRGSR
jgi:hypothetical protein